MDHLPFVVVPLAIWATIALGNYFEHAEKMKALEKAPCVSQPSPTPGATP